MRARPPTDAELGAGLTFGAGQKDSHDSSFIGSLLTAICGKLKCIRLPNNRRIQHRFLGHHANVCLVTEYLKRSLQKDPGPNTGVTHDFRYSRIWQQMTSPSLIGTLTSFCGIRCGEYNNKYATWQDQRYF